MNYPLYITQDGYLFALIAGILTDGAEHHSAFMDTAGRVCFQYTKYDVFPLELFEDSKTFSAARVKSFWAEYNSIINL